MPAFGQMLYRLLSALSANRMLLIVLRLRTLMGIGETRLSSADATERVAAWRGFLGIDCVLRERRVIVEHAHLRVQSRIDKALIIRCPEEPPKIV